MLARRFHYRALRAEIGFAEVVEFSEVVDHDAVTVNFDVGCLGHLRLQVARIGRAVRNSGSYSMTCDGKPIRKLVFMYGGSVLATEQWPGANTFVCPEARTRDSLTGFRYYCQQYRYFLNGEQKISNPHIS